MFMSVAGAIAIADPTRTRLRLAALRLWVEAALALARQVSDDLGRDLIGAARLMFRLSRGVRLALALHARLSDPTNPLFQPRPARARAAGAEACETRREPAAPPRSAGAGRSRLRADLSSDDAILRRPLTEIVRVICQALGVTPDWSLWSDETEAGPDPAPPAPDPSPERLHAAPAPRPRPQPIAKLPPRPPVAERLIARLRRSCAPLALIPIVDPARGRWRLSAI